MPPAPRHPFQSSDGVRPARRLKPAPPGVVACGCLLALIAAPRPCAGQVELPIDRRARQTVITADAQIAPFSLSNLDHVFLNGERAIGPAPPLNVSGEILPGSVEVVAADVASREPEIAEPAERARLPLAAAWEARTLSAEEGFGSQVIDVHAWMSRILNGLVVVVLAALAGVFILRYRVGRFAPATPGDSRKLRTLETLRVGPRCQVLLVQGLGSHFLVGVDAGGIRAITNVQQPFGELLDGPETAGREGAETSPQPIHTTH